MDKKVLHLAYLKDMLEKSYFEDSGTFAIATKILEILRDEDCTVQSAKHILTACGSTLLECDRKEILKNYEFALPTEKLNGGEVMEYDKTKEILEKQLDLLLERSKFCDDKSLTPITELMIGIAVLLQGVDNTQGH